MKEIKKIRIGNDIRLAVDLSQYLVTGDRTDTKDRKVYNTETGEFVQFETGTSPISIRSIEAYLICKPNKEHHKHSLYDLCTSGVPSWHIHPYNGFGLRPRFDLIYKKLHCNKPETYKAQAYATSKLNVVEVVFPAEDQRRLGIYNLVIVAKLYAPGFNRANLKTITVDMSNVFELVATTELGVDTGIHIDVNVIQDILPDGSDAPQYRYEDKYLSDIDFDENINTINLLMSDGEQMHVDLDNRLGWYYGD